jgi:hypothetical protein
MTTSEITYQQRKQGHAGNEGESFYLYLRGQRSRRGGVMLRNDMHDTKNTKDQGGKVTKYKEERLPVMDSNTY